MQARRFGPADFLVNGGKDGVCCNRMRRILAAMLVLLFGFTPIAPAFAVNGDSQLPACCRRTGQHHCLMMSASGDSGQTQLQNAPSHCPLFPHLAIVGHTSFFVPGAGGVYGAMMHYPGLSALTETAHHASLCRGHQKRGPPLFIA